MRALLREIRKALGERWRWTLTPPPRPPATVCLMIHRPFDLAHWLPNMPRGSERI